MSLGWNILDLKQSIVEVALAADVSTDVETLMNMVQQQAAAIQTLQARLAALENGQTNMRSEVTTLKTSFSGLLHNVTGIAADVHGAKTESDKQVAFSAHMSRTHVVVDNSPFVFDVVSNAVGQGYDPLVGVFTAPYSGLYVFHFVIVNDNTAPFLRAAIMKGSSVLGVGTVDGGSNNSFDDGSALVTARLMKGDQVFVRRERGAVSIYGSELCNFSGFLVRADV